MPNITYAMGSEGLKVLTGQVDGSALIEAFIDFIVENFTPDEIFGLDAINRHVADSRDPSSVFEDAELSEWATDNGFTRDD